MDNNFLEIVNLIKESNNIVVLTGAGMSTASRIPDFRSKQGLYNVAPETILSRNYFFTHTEHFYDFVEQNLIHKDAKPNQGHKILAKWEKENKINQIITQNIDGLHQESGSKNVIEFHGTIKTATCYNPKCNKKYTMDEIVKRKKIEEEYYVCDCGVSSTRRYIKPDVILYGDSGGKWLTKNGFYDITQMVVAADLILALGTSFQVYPFRNIPSYRKSETPMVIINKGKTELDNSHNVHKIDADISDTLVAIDDLINK